MPVRSTAARRARRCCRTCARARCVTDVGSVKGAVVAALEALLPGRSPVRRRASDRRQRARRRRGGAAPICSSARAASLTPTPRTDAAALARVRALWEGVGARVEEMTPAAHDRALAWTSHLRARARLRAGARASTRPTRRCWRAPGRACATRRASPPARPSCGATSSSPTPTAVGRRDRRVRRRAGAPARCDRRRRRGGAARRCWKRRCGASGAARSRRERAAALAMRPLERPPDATVRVPGSKSITNRALLLAALADGRSELRRRAVQRRHPLHGRGAARARRRACEPTRRRRASCVDGCGGRWPATQRRSLRRQRRHGDALPRRRAAASATGATASTAPRACASGRSGISSTALRAARRAHPLRVGERRAAGGRRRRRVGRRRGRAGGRALAASSSPPCCRSRRMRRAT